MLQKLLQKTANLDMHFSMAKIFVEIFGVSMTVVEKVLFCEPSDTNHQKFDEKLLIKILLLPKMQIFSSKLVSRTDCFDNGLEKSYVKNN